MYEKQMRKFLRSKFNPMGWSLLLYYLIMNLAVIMVDLTDIVIRLIEIMPVSNDTWFETIQQIAFDSVMGNGWGYFLAAAIGFLLLLFWKGKHFCFHEIWVSRQQMRVWDFTGLLCILVGGQLVFQLFSAFTEWLLNLIGFSAMEAIESSALQNDTFSMFFYVGVLAPIAEEILFRGLILRSLEPWGKRFAIFASSFLFGIFHGNLVQSPFAFAVGLVLGYTAIEYSITWAMVLHMFNNLILSDALDRILSFLPMEVANAVSWGLILFLTLIGVVVIIIRRKEIALFFRKERNARQCVKAFFTTPGVVVLSVLMILMMIVTITPLYA